MQEIISKTLSVWELRFALFGSQLDIGKKKKMNNFVRKLEAICIVIYISIRCT